MKVDNILWVKGKAKSTYAISIVLAECPNGVHQGICEISRTCKLIKADYPMSWIKDPDINLDYDISGEM